MVEKLQRRAARTARKCWRGLLDSVGIPARFALIKLVTGGLRIGVSARLAKQALADFGRRRGQRDRGALARADAALCRRCSHWLEGKGPKPEKTGGGAVPAGDAVQSRSEDGDLEKLEPADYAAEWKWDGIRVQVVSERGVRRLYSRTGDDISPAFPDLVDAMNFDAVLDGELLVGRPPEWTGTFSDLQQRLNRKNVSPKMREQFPVFVRCYDILQQGERTRAPCRFTERRGRLDSVSRDARPAPLRPVAAKSPSPTGKSSTACARRRRIRSSKA